MPCSDTYAGPNAFSENETAAVDNFLNEHSSKFDTYLAFHSYSQLILSPYGTTKDKVVSIMNFNLLVKIVFIPWFNKQENYDELQAIGEAAADRLFKKHGTVYEVGNTVEVLCKFLKRFIISNFNRDNVL